MNENSENISLHFCIHGIRATLTRTVNYFLTDSPLKLSAFVCSNVSTRIVEDYSSSLHRFFFFFFDELVGCIHNVQSFWRWGVRWLFKANKYLEFSGSTIRFSGQSFFADYNSQIEWTECLKVASVGKIVHQREGGKLAIWLAQWRLQKGMIQCTIPGM